MNIIEVLGADDQQFYAGTLGDINRQVRALIFADASNPNEVIAATFRKGKTLGFNSVGHDADGSARKPSRLRARNTIQEDVGGAASKLLLLIRGAIKVQGCEHRNIELPAGAPETTAVIMNEINLVLANRQLAAGKLLFLQPLQIFKLHCRGIGSEHSPGRTRVGAGGDKCFVAATVKLRSEERRVGKECRSWMSREHLKKKQSIT